MIGRHLDVNTKVHGSPRITGMVEYWTIGMMEGTLVALVTLLAGH